MAALQQEIQVKIKAFIEGLKEVRALSADIEKLRSGGSAGVGVVEPGSANNLQEVVAAIREVQKAVESLKPGAIEKLFKAFEIGSAVVNAVSRFREFEQGLGRVRERLSQGANSARSFFSSLTGAATSKAQSILGTVKDKAAELGSVLPGIARGGASAGLGIGALVGTGALAATGIGLVSVAVLGLVAALTALAAAIPLAVGGLFELFQKGIAYKSQLEQTKLGIAALISSFNEFRNSEGVKLEGAEALTASLELADEQLKKLQIDAINTTATFGQIAPAFQSAIAPGTKAGLTLDQIREITVGITQAAGVLGVPYEQLNQEVRAILEGTIDMNARIAEAIGLTPKLVKDFKDAGTLAEELNKRFLAFNVAGVEAAKTFSGLTSNIEEAFNVFAGLAVERSFEVLKQRVAKLLPELFDFKNARISQSLKPLTDAFDRLFTKAINRAGDFVDYLIRGAKQIAKFVDDNKELIYAIFQIIGSILAIVVRMIGSVVRLGGSTNTWRTTLQLTAVILKGVELTLFVIEQKIREAVVAFNVLFALVKLAIPGFQTLAVLAALIAGKPIELPDVSGSGSGTETKPILPPGLPSGGGKGKKGGGGGGGKQDNTAQAVRQQREAELDLQRTYLESVADLEKDALERAQRALEQSFEARKISVASFYDEQLRLSQAANAEELNLQRALLDIERQKLEAKLAGINAEKGKSAGERAAEIGQERARYAGEVAQIEDRITKLQREGRDITAKSNADRAKAAQDLEKTYADVRNQLDELTGLSGDVAVREIKERFRVVREELVANFGEVSTQVQTLDALIANLTKRSKFEEVTDAYEESFARLRFELERINTAVDAGDIGAREGEVRRIAAQTRFKQEVIETLEALRKINVVLKDPKLAQQIDDIGVEIESVGKSVNNIGRSLNEDLRRDSDSFFFSIIRQTKTLKDAALDALGSILDSLARVASQNLTESIFGKLLDVDSQGNQGGGGIGGFLAGLFGGGKKKRGDDVGLDKDGNVLVRASKSTDDVALSFFDGIFGKLKGGFTGLFDKLGGVFNGLFDSLGSVIGNVGSGISSLVTGALKFLGSAFGFGFADGGLTPDIGTETSDSILARLSKNEFVIKAKSVRGVGANVLRYINDFGRLPAFAVGGLVNSNVAAIAAGGASVFGASSPTIINQRFDTTIATANAREFRLGQKAVERDLARAARKGVTD
ncbi:MAG: hypothetical protein MSG64_15650 [Pyrinomonadaceae bacterium MAG19_C2-C3]|nr:hypothetical protein [Pyrinomonadaceae bacterium MAG19_C2-C3]